jgi:hypothetical protein
MTTTLEPAPKKLPKDLVALVNESIDSMSEEELRAWKRDSAKIMGGGTVPSLLSHHS